MSRPFIVAAGLAALSALTLSGAAQAQDQAVHITVGDLSQPAGVAVFHRQLAEAVDTLCGDRWQTHLVNQSGHDACAAAVRDEAVAQLTPENRQELAQAEGVDSKMQVAKAGR